jgi:rod shape-determining protein MreB and related proteins
MRFLSSLNRRVGIDLGTDRVRVWSDQEDEVIDQPACLVVDTTAGKVVAVGDDALAMVGRVKSGQQGVGLKIYFPIQQGVVHDAKMAKALLEALLQKLFRQSFFFRPIMMVSVAGGATAAQRAAVIDILYAVGAREAYTIDQALASAIGAGIPIADASGSFMLQLGAGVLEAAIISLGSVTVQSVSVAAGNTLDELIKQVLHDQVSLVVSTQTARKLKEQVASVDETMARSVLAAGQDVKTRSPKELSIETELLRPAIRRFVSEYETLLKDVLSQIPPELTTDVIDKGLLLSGGLSQLHGLDHYLVQHIGIPVSVVEYPETTVIKGIQQVLEHIEEFKESLGYQV